MSCRLDSGDAFSLHVEEDLACLSRADDSSALDALERHAVKSATKLNVALAQRASAGEYHRLFHVVGLRR